MGIDKLEQPVTDAGWTVGTMLTRGTSDGTDARATAACTAAAGGHGTAGRQLLPARLPFWSVLGSPLLVYGDRATPAGTAANATPTPFRPLRACGLVLLLSPRCT